MAVSTGGDVFTLEDRILAAAIRCVARWGVRKTTLDDVAREAGCGRATIYRTFPGGKDSVMLAAGEREVERLLVGLAGEVELALTLEDALVAAIAGAARALASHAALRFLFEHEPGVVLPFLSFDGLDPLLERAVAFGRPRLERFVDPATAAALAEWVTRIVVAYGDDTSQFVDLTDPDQTRRLVTQYVLPGVPSDVTISLTDSKPVNDQEQLNVLH